MNHAGSEEGKREIIIVRRGGHDDDHDHHGGVWKIAFADFMTAMMCFFLVMWLINAANEQTRAAVASYFNPVKLIDRATNRKGIDNLGKGPQIDDARDEVQNESTEQPGKARLASTGPASEEDASSPVDVPEHTDQSLFANPYAVLAEIAQDTSTMQNVSMKGDGGARDSGPSSGASGGESYRDPFAPDFWSSQSEAPAEAADTSQKSYPEGAMTQQAAEASVRPASDPADATAAVSQDDPFAFKAEHAEAPSPAREEADRAIAEALQPPPPQFVAAADPTPTAENKTPQPPSEAQRSIAERIRQELEQDFGGKAGLDGITVTPTDDGVAISIADDIRGGMFEIGSAVPRRELVLAMEKIGHVLAEQSGKVTINGHTDGRPFAGKEYDNWRLSSARAHATYYMLVRGGLEESRVGSITGYADRRLKVPEDPYASGNRRIEILLERAG